MYKRYVFILCVFMFLVSGCGSDADAVSAGTSDVEITWRSGGTVTYSYSGGVQSGFSWYIKFNVTSGSGEVRLLVEVTQGEGNAKTVSHTVHENQEYTVQVSVSKSGQIGCGQGSTISRIEVSTASSPQRMPLSITCGGSTGSRVHTIGNVSVYES